MSNLKQSLDVDACPFYTTACFGLTKLLKNLFE